VHNNSVIQVKGHDKLIRDPKTKAILNTDSMEYNNYISRKKERENASQELSRLKSDVEQIKNDIVEIKDLKFLLTDIISKLDKL
jgi:hypothetical protein